MPRAKGGSIPPPRVMVHPGHGGSIAELNEHDVLSGRGGRINNHPGNITFRAVVEDYKKEYLDPRTRKLEKAHVAARLVAQIRSTNPPGRFLREDPDNPGKYVEIGDQKAWKKAGQALREDAPDVRKEIDEEMEAKEKEAKERAKDPKYATPQPQQPPYQQQQPHRPGVPAGIPPSVSYSPGSQPMSLAPPPLPPPSTGPPSGGGGGSRPDPPEAPGVTGYRQPPLRYFESGRGGPGRGGHSGRGRGPPPPPSHHPQQQYPGHPPQQGYHPPPPNYYGPPPPMNQPPPPHGHHQHYHHHGGPQYQQHPHGPPPQFQQQQPHPHHHHPGQYPSNGYSGPPPQPQFAAPQDKSRKKSTSPTPIIAGVQAAAQAGVNQTMDAVTGLANKVKKAAGVAQPNTSSRTEDFPLTTSVGTDFTMSDISAFGESKTMMLDSTRTNPMQSVQEGQHEQGQTHQGAQQQIGQGAVHKQSTSSKSSGGSNRSKESFTMSDLMNSNQSLGFSFGHSGRTRSFPDLMLSTGDLLPPLPAEGDSDRDILDALNDEGGGGGQEQRSSSGRILKAPFHRHSSSESSNHSMTSLTIKGFHPVRGRSNTAMSGLNDAMSIMSLESRKSIKSESSSWIDNFRSMQSIGSDQNPWEAGSGRQNPYGDDGSVRSFLSDVSNELNALDLAGPLLPPIMTDNGLNDSLGDTFMRPDP